MKIRTMKLADVSDVSRILTECYTFLAKREGFSDSQLEYLLEERCSESYVENLYHEFEHYVAALNNCIVGIVGVDKNDIAELWVAPDYHQQGIGTALFRKAEEVISQKGYTFLTVRTTGYSTPFYEAMEAHIIQEKPCDKGPLKGWILTYMEKSLQIKDQVSPF